MRGISDLLEGLADVLSGTFDGFVYQMRLSDGREVVVRGIYQADHREAEIGNYGARTFVSFPMLDVHAAELRRLGVEEPEDELLNASVMVEGSEMTVSGVRPGAVFVRCELSCDHSAV